MGKADETRSLHSPKSTILTPPGCPPKRDRTAETVTRKLNNIIKRLNKIQATHDVEIHFCARYHRYFQYNSSPLFRPTKFHVVRDIYIDAYYTVCD